MGRSESALTASALASGLDAPEPRNAAAHASMMVSVLMRLDERRAEHVVAVLDNARLRMETVRRSLGRANDPTTQLVMQAAMEAVRQDACSRLEALIEETRDAVAFQLPKSDCVPGFRGQTSSL